MGRVIGSARRQAQLYPHLARAACLDGGDHGRQAVENGAARLWHQRQADIARQHAQTHALAVCVVGISLRPVQLQLGQGAYLQRPQMVLRVVASDLAFEQAGLLGIGQVIGEGSIQLGQ